MDNNFSTTSEVTPIYGAPQKQLVVLNKYILVSKVVEAETTNNGLKLSAQDADKIRYKKATVVSVGALVTPNLLKPLDVILFDKVSGHIIRIDNEPFTLIQEKDVVVCFPHS